MFIPGNVNRRAFTLLEVMLAVVIIAMITMTVYRFVSANLTAIRVTTAVSQERAAMVTLVRTIEAELQDLPPRIPNVIIGTPHKFNNQPSDELEWYCKAGNGLFTGAANGEWRTTLAIQPATKASRELEIGLRRRPASAKPGDYTWLPLMGSVAGLEVRYFDPRLNAWLERWVDGNARPLLVRLRIWRTTDAAPYESIIAIPSANLLQ